MEMSTKASAVPCLLCRLEVGSDLGQYEDHLRDVHGVWSNRSWLVDQTFTTQNSVEGTKTSAGFQDSLTKIKVKSSTEAEYISDIRVLSVKVEDTISCNSLRRSSRKRSACSSPVEGKEAKLKVINSTISIREPIDMMILEVETSQILSNGKLISKDCFGVLQKPRGSANLDLNFDQVGQTKTVRDNFAGESGFKCENCDKMFEVSYMKFHLEEIHGMSLEDYSEVHGELTGGKMKQQVKVWEATRKKDVNDKEMKIMKMTDGMKTKDLNDKEVKVVKMKDILNVSSDEANNNDAVPISKKSFRSDLCDQVQPSLENKADEDSALSEESLMETQIVVIEEGIETKDVNENVGKELNNVEEFVDKNDATNSDYGYEETVPVSIISKDDEEYQDGSSFVKEVEKNLPFHMSFNEGNVYSDNYEDSCIVECSICDKHMPVERLRGHTSSEHHLPISKYKEQFGSQPAFVKMTFHLCRLCGKEVLLDKDSVAGHVRGSHNWSAKQYNAEYMVYRRSRIDKSLLFENVQQSPQEGAGVAKCSQASGSSEQRWFDANTFNCNICTFSSSSLGTFKKHVKSDHTTSLAKFSASYNKTDVWYKCQCCDKEVFHEKKSIKAHVEGHLLSMEQYAKLYERKSILKSEDAGENEIVSVDLQPCQELDLLNEVETDPLHDPLEITSINLLGDVEENPLIIIQDLTKDSQPTTPVFLSVQDTNDLPEIESPGVLKMMSDIIESVIPSTSSPTPCANPDEVDQVSQTVADTGIPGTEPSPVKEKVGSLTLTLPDIFLYLCPSPGCDFHTDYKGMLCGTAAAHGLAVHKTIPGQIKASGLQWKKVSLETRMEELFAED